jgi:hypothetical protein
MSTLAFADDASFESSHITLHIKNKHSVASSRRDHRRTSAFITGASAALTSPSAESTVQSSSQQQHNTTTSTPSPTAGMIQKFTVITVSGKEKKWAEQRYRMITSIKARLLGTRRQSGTVPGTVPDLPESAGPGDGDSDAPPSPSPICPESGTLPRARPRFAGDGDAPPSLIPTGGPGSAPWSKGTTMCAIGSDSRAVPQLDEVPGPLAEKRSPGLQLSDARPLGAHAGHQQ